MRLRLSILALVLVLLVPASSGALVAREDYAGPGDPPESLPTRAEAAKKTGNVTPRRQESKRAQDATQLGSVGNATKSGAGTSSD
ncbi:hypothetical protein [Desulfovibrio aminophilus]|uniref:hypothetical protein n=1 Tax=Desulfovibrio aminophilus TaxID=81425 RepID=UPI003398A2AA